MAEDDDLVWEDVLGKQPAQISDHIRLVLQLPPIDAISTECNNEDRIPRPILRQIQRAHLLCLLSRSAFIEACIDNCVLQALILSLVPAPILSPLIVQQFDEQQLNMLSPLLTWFCEMFEVRKYSMKEFGEAPDEMLQDTTCLGSILQQMMDCVEQREGEPDLLMGLFIALLRSLGHRCRLVRLIDVLGSKQVDKTVVNQRKRRRESLIEVSNQKIQNSNTETKRKQSISKGLNKRARRVSNSNMDLEEEIDKSKEQKGEEIDEDRKKEENAVMKKGDLEFELQMQMAVQSTALAATVKDNSAQQSQSNLEEKRRVSSSNSIAAKQLIKKPEISGSAWQQKDSDKRSFTWCEVFCGPPETGTWKHVDPYMGWIDRAHNVDGGIVGVQYIVGINKGHIQDITLRYCMDFMRVLRSRDEEWWQCTLGLINGSISLLGSQEKNVEPIEQLIVAREEAQLQQLLHAQQKGVPKTIEGFRKHPLYVLQRHIAKNQMVEPGQKPIGLHKGEVYYLRASLAELRTSTGWMRVGRQVISDEKNQPAQIKTLINGKIPETGKKSSEKAKSEEQNIFGQATEQQSGETSEEKKYVQLYGYWQTEVWIPPVAVGGIVPVNEFGNVECPPLVASLPIGTVHLQYPKIATTCRKVGVHYAHALTKFDVGYGGKMAPVIDGVVVCEEVADLVLKTYLQEQEDFRKREILKRQKEADRNWKTLFETMLTRINLNKPHQKTSNIQKQEQIGNQDAQSTDKGIQIENIEVEDI